MPDTAIDLLETQLRTTLAGGQLTLPPAFLNQIDLAELPTWLVPESGLAMADATIDRVGDSHVRAKGTVANVALGSATITVDITDSGQGITADLAAALDAELSFDKLLATTGMASVRAFANFLHAEAINALSTLRQNEHLQLRLSLSGAQQIHLGPIQLSIILDTALVQLAPPGLVNLSGKMRLGDLSLDLTLPAGATTRLQASAPDVTVEKLASALGLRLPPLPALDLLKQKLEGFSIETFNGAMCLGALCPVPGLGVLSLSVAMSNGQLGLALALQVAPSFKPSIINPALKPFDALSGIINFGSPALVLATVTDSAFTVYDAAGNWSVQSVVEGVEFNGQLQLTGFGLEAVRLLTGTGQLPFVVPLDPSLADLHLIVDLERKIDLLPGVLMLDNFKLSLSPEPLDITVSGHAQLTAFGQKFPDFTLEEGVSPGQIHIGFSTASPWQNPLGLPITIKEVGLQIDSPPLEYGVFGTVELKHTTLSVATKFVGDAPTFLAAKLDGGLSTSILLEDLTGIKLPLPWEPELSDASLYVVLNPLGETIGTHLYPAGIGVSGTITILGFAASMAMSAMQGRIFATATLDKPILLPPLLEITGFGGSSVPALAIDSSHDPVASFNARIAMIGISEDIAGVIGADKISFVLNDMVGPVIARLNAAVTKDSLTAAGTASFGLEGRIGPLTVAGISYGTIALNVQLDAACAITGDTHGNADVKVEANFVVGGIAIHIPQIGVNISSFADLPAALLAYVQQHIADLFKQFVADVDVWLRAAASGLIKGIDNAAKTLISGFAKDVNYTAGALVNTLRNDVTTATNLLHAAGQSAQAIAAAMAGLGRSPNEIRGALTILDLPAAEIASAMKAAFPGIPHVDTAAIPHVDFGASPHVDVAAVHQDVGAKHTDLSTSHVNAITGHVNTTTGHVNTGGGWIPHGDIGGVHADYGGAHADSGGVHTDFGTPHVNLSISPHADVAAKAHVDMPSTLHVDVP